MTEDQSGALGMIVGGDDEEGNPVIECSGYNIEHHREELYPTENMPPNWNLYSLGMTGDLGTYREDTDTTCYCNNDLCADWTVNPQAADRSGR